MKHLRSAVLVAVLMLLVMVAGVLMISSDAAATDPSPMTVSDVKLVDLAEGDRFYSTDNRLRLFAPEWGIADIYVTAALSETDQLVVTVQHSPDGSNAWVDTANVYTYTAATAPAASHVRVPIYGQALGLNMDISGTVYYTPTVYVVLKQTAGE